jgi:hypothetical protein
VNTAARIFINYRRSDASGWARQLHDNLSTRFGAERVFRDVAIEPGVDYIDHIERVMDACEVCIVVIGPRWADAASADGRRRLEQPDDLVSLEIQRALSRPDVHVIPALVEGAKMPAEHELPIALQPLTRRNACELSDTRWDYDVDVLDRRLRQVLGESTVGHKSTVLTDPARRREQPPETATTTLLAAVATLTAAACAALVATSLIDPSSMTAPDWSRLSGYAIERGAIWAIIGAIVVGAAATAFGRVRVPLGQALTGAGAGFLGGAVGGAAFIALKRFGHATHEYDWLLTLISIAPPAILQARVLAGVVGVSARDCELAALAAAAAAALVHNGDRTWIITLHAVIVVSAAVAVIVATRYSTFVPGRTMAQRGDARRAASRSRQGQ